MRTISRAPRRDNSDLLIRAQIIPARWQAMFDELAFFTGVICRVKWLALGAGRIDLANLRGHDRDQAPILGAAKTEPPRRSLTES